jgi:methyl-accepting chemotaxis protein
MKAVFEAIRRFFLPRDIATRPLEEQRRMALLVILELFNVSISLLSALGSMSNPTLMVTSLGLSVGHFLVLLLLRVTGKLGLCVNIGLVFIYGVVGMRLLNSGGVHSPAIWLTAALPMGALLLMGRRAAYIWMALSVLMIAGIGFVQHTGVVAFPVVNDSVISVAIRDIFAPIAITTACLLFVRDRENAEHRLQEEQAATQRKVDEAVEQLRAEEEAMHRKDAESLQKSEQQQQYLEQSISAILMEMNRLAQGNLLVGLTVSGTDDIARLYRGFNEVVTNMRGMIGNIDTMVDETAETTGKIAQQADTVRRATNTQARQAAEIATAVEEMTVTIRENTRQTSFAAEEADHTRSDAQQGGEIVGKAIAGIQNIARVVSKAAETIQALGQSSETIGEVTRVIEEIADQTNLLALNAAIEAARAGEQGRGFAVVADEVRKLAERTQQATKEISGTIRQIQSQTTLAVNEMASGEVAVTQGQQAAMQAQEALSRIIERVKSVADVIAQVASASEEQSATVDSISQSVDEIRRLTEQANTAMQQTAHNVEHLHNLMHNLRDLTSGFQLGR